jgi:hypothetical protein
LLAERSVGAPQISEPLSPAVDCPDCRRAVEDAWDEARSENIKRWTFGGPACSSECLKAADDDGHLYSCQRKAYICAGATSEFLLPGVMAARWPYDAGRILVVEDAWDQAHAEQADRDLSADPERLADFQDRVRQAFDVAEEVADREAHRATGDLAALAESVVVMPIASATAVSAALGAGQLAILVSQEVIDAALAEIAEQSGVPLEQVRELHDAVLNGQFPMDDGRPAMSAKTIEATISVSIAHHAGPEIADPEHVIRWICADGMFVDGRYNASASRSARCTPIPMSAIVRARFPIYAADIVSAGFED